eukprot:TRINITY_DN13282_c0_g1_i7.p1 TRINITY_DN13282_c0_g1~~TRINITY_DN13282_c0_g1_i7.p1  ORF type:complete len:163 (+),score=38.47 TRINITY_DN13282_c0_g1_i7:165-653(+)
MQASASAEKKSCRTSSLPKDDYVKGKYEAYIKAQEDQLKKLEKELVYTKEDLKIKEEQLKIMTTANQQLTEEVNSLKQQSSQDTYIKAIHSKLLHILNTKDQYTTLVLANPSNSSLEELLTAIDKLINSLIAENTQLKSSVKENESPLKTLRGIQCEAKAEV